MTKPTNLKELLEYLRDNPKLRVFMLNGDIVRGEFLSDDETGIWLREKVDGEIKDHFLPLACRLTEAAAQAEAGLRFDRGGFELHKFGRAIRVEYLSS